MRRRPDVYLEIALNGLRNATSFVGDRSEEQYLSDIYCQSAVERQLEVAGDALGQLRKSNPELFKRIPDGDLVVAFRNVLAHGYASLDHRRVYEAATLKASELLDVLQSLLDEFPDQA